jgi:hypothetical protein
LAMKSIAKALSNAKVAAQIAIMTTLIHTVHEVAALRRTG